MAISRAGGGFGPPATATPPATFLFESTENPLGSPWVNGDVTGLDWQDMQSGSGNVYGIASSPSSYDDNIAALTGYNTNHYVEGTIYRAGGYAPAVAHEIELHVRCAITANSITSYELLMNSDAEWQVVRWDGAIGNFYTGITPTNHNGGPGTACVHGDVIRFEVSGSDFSVKKNGTLVWTFTDTTHTNGGPGVGAFWRPEASAVPSSLGFSQVTGGNLP